MGRESLPLNWFYVYTPVSMTPTHRWTIPPKLSAEADANLREYPEILRQILYNRGHSTEEEAQAYLQADVLFDTSPRQLTGMEVTTKRIREAIAGDELVAIYGDYDVDGVTATALLIEGLTALGAKVRPYIPNRFDEGYGINKTTLEELAQAGAKLVISVDCGIRSPVEARHARSLGLDLVISDHHEPAGDLPEALAVINPKQEGDRYPEKYLAGVGVAYKIIQALIEDIPAAKNPVKLEELLELVALGTVADLAPLEGENRSLVRAGLRQMKQTKRQGLFSLANVAGVTLATVNATHIGFMLGPRLNAAGRLESAMAALDLLLTRDVMEAGRLAQLLDGQNRERQAITRKIQTEADALAMGEDPDSLVLFAVDPEFNPGVVGLAASRLVETHYRPAIVGQRGEETTRCSCRSIPEFNITEALDQCADLLVQHGGHAAAAGFTVRNENLEELKRRLKEIAREKMGSLDLRRTFTADVEIKLKDLKMDLLRQLERLQPTGYGNPEARFIARNLQVKSQRKVGAEGKHLKLTLSDGFSNMDAIGFRLGERPEEVPGRVDVLFTFETNEYNGYTSLQMNLKDIKAAGTTD